MTPASLLLAAAALVPAMTGPVPSGRQADPEGAFVVALCNGGSMAIAFGRGGPPPGTAPCCAKGCRSGERRKRFDPKQ